MKDSEAAVAPSLPVRPRLAGDVLVHPPVESDGPWIIERDGRRYFRVGADLARLAKSLTGTQNQRELLVMLGAPWTEDLLTNALRQLQKLELLDDGEQRTMRKRRVFFVPPMAVQFTVVDPSRFLTRLSSLISVLSRPGALVLYVVLAIGGMIALGAQRGTMVRLISEPVPLLVFAVIFIGNLVATVIHEIAHGAVLTHFGGKPRRMGFMLFYLIPAFFCDVSDGWRLPRPAQRAKVALAGIAAQFVIAGAIALGALAVPESTLRDSLVLLSIVIYAAGSVNVIPFVKFDGYLALMSSLDISDLRTSAMDDARAFLARALYGGTYERKLPGRRWVVPFGLGCIVFPMFLVGFVALGLWSEIFTRMGWVGALINFSLVMLIVVGIAREVRDVHRLALGRRPRIGRMLVVDGVLIAAVVLALTQIHVGRSVSAGYIVDDDGAHLYVANAADADLVQAGQQVRLQNNGVLRRPQTGTAELGAEPSARTEVSTTKFAPLDYDMDLPSAVIEFQLEIIDRPKRSEGVARVDIGDRSLADWMYGSYVSPLL